MNRSKLRKMILKEMADMMSSGAGSEGRLDVRVYLSNFGTFGRYMISGNIRGNQVMITSDQNYGGKMIDVNQFSYNPEGAVRSAFAKKFGEPPEGFLEGVKIDVDIERPPSERGYYG